MKTEYPPSAVQPPVSPSPVTVAVSSSNRKLVPYVLIHGMWGTNNQWRDFGNHGHETVVANLYGHTTNATKRCLDYVSMNTYINDIIRHIPGPSVLIGHSLGALVAQVVATRAPRLVKGLVLMASVPPGGIRIPFQARFLRYFWPILTGRGFTLTEKDKEFVSQGLPVQFGPESGRVLREIMFGKFKVTRLYCPVLVIVASRDQFYPFRVQEKIADLHNADITWCNSTHMLHIDPNVREQVFERINGWAATRQFS